MNFLTHPRSVTPPPSARRTAHGFSSSADEEAPSEQAQLTSGATLGGNHDFTSYSDEELDRVIQALLEGIRWARSLLAQRKRNPVVSPDKAAPESLE